MTLSAKFSLGKYHVGSPGISVILSVVSCWGWCCRKHWGGWGVGSFQCHLLQAQSQAFTEPDCLLVGGGEGVGSGLPIPQTQKSWRKQQKELLQQQNGLGLIVREREDKKKEEVGERREREHELWDAKQLCFFMRRRKLSLLSCPWLLHCCWTCLA